MLDEILDYNRRFVEEHHYKPYETSKYPDRKIAILTCMDTRLTHLLPAAMGLKNGEVKLIKNAGGIVFSPYDTTVRSLLIAILELGVEEILEIGHTDCGVCGMHPDSIRHHLVARASPPKRWKPWTGTPPSTWTPGSPGSAMSSPPCWTPSPCCAAIP